MDWIDLVQDRDQCKVLMNAFHKTLGSSWVAAQLAASQEGLSSMSEWVKTHMLAAMSHSFLYLTQWSRVLLKKLIVSQLVKKFLVFFTSKCLSVFRAAHC
jgi:hypothetical protein